MPLWCHHKASCTPSLYCPSHGQRHKSSCPQHTFLIWHTQTKIRLQVLDLWDSHVHSQACAHTSSHLSKNTPKHSPPPPHTDKHTMCPKVQVPCPLHSLCHPSLQVALVFGTFTSSLVFACANCPTVQTLPGRWCPKVKSVGRCVQVFFVHVVDKADLRSAARYGQQSSKVTCFPFARCSPEEFTSGSSECWEVMALLGFLVRCL